MPPERIASADADGLSGGWPNLAAALVDRAGLRLTIRTTDGEKLKRAGRSASAGGGYHRPVAARAEAHDDWASRAAGQLAQAGYRRGGARSAVVELLGSQPCALSATEIEDALRGGSRPVGRASIYRILDELERLGLVSRVDVAGDTARYEAVRADARHHDHLVCDDCGEIVPFRDEELERTLKRVADRVSLAVEEHEVVLHGQCENCRG